MVEDALKMDFSSFKSRSQPTLKFIHTEFDYCHLWMKAEEKFYGLFIKLPHIKTEKQS